ncbi:MAG: hypothetical protein AB8F74_16595 [Saprospiraceae bacterium]
MKHLVLLITIAFLPFENKDSTSLNSELSSSVGNISFGSNPESIDNNTSSEFIRAVLFKGTLNEKLEISLYLKEEGHPCGGNMTTINAMYKYNHQDKWILLSVSTDKQKENYCMVEDNFTGLLLLEENEGFFNGSWISPDAKKQFKIELGKVELNKSTAEQLDEILFDDLLYNKNDC